MDNCSSNPTTEEASIELITSSYRTVSNLSYLSRLAKKAMPEQINHHCNANNLLHDYQLAYREKGAVNLLLKLANDLLWLWRGKMYLP